MSYLTKIAANCSAFLRRVILTRENGLALLVALLMLLIYTVGTMGVQPTFVYGGF